MAEITIYTTRFCPFCVRAKSLLSNKRAEFKEIAVDGDSEMRRQLLERTGQRTVPQIWIGQQHVGGCDELMTLDRQGRLDTMLAQ